MRLRYKAINATQMQIDEQELRKFTFDLYGFILSSEVIYGMQLSASR